MKKKQHTHYYNKLSKFVLISSILSTSVYADATGELYYAYAQKTVKAQDLYPEYLLKRIHFNSKDSKIEKILGDVRIIPERSLPIAIHANGLTLLPHDRIQTLDHSMATIQLTQDYLILIGENSQFEFYENTNKIYFSVLEGNVRLLIKNAPQGKSIYLKTPEFTAEIHNGDYATSVSKFEGSSFLALTGKGSISQPKGNLLVMPSEIATKLKNSSLQKKVASNQHKSFAHSKLSFDYTLPKNSISLKQAYDLILKMSPSILQRLSSKDAGEKEKLLIETEILTLLQNEKKCLITSHEVQALVQYILIHTETIKQSEAQKNDQKAALDREKELKELQKQKLIKAQQLKVEENRLLKEADEVEAKFKN